MSEFLIGYAQIGQKGSSVLSHAVSTLSEVRHHEGHEEHEGRKLHVEILLLF